MSIPPSIVPAEEKQPELRDLFELFSPFQVPAYQRAYAWEPEHIDQFVEDLREHPSDKPYYLGHFLLERSKDGVIYVIDGQQRLTTLALAFGCMKRLLSELPAHQPCVDDFTKRFLGGRFEMRFQTVKEDQSLLEGLIFDGHAKATHRSRSQERLINASKRLQHLFAGELPEQLVAWAKCLNTAQITYLVVKDKVQATQIFTFQNSRGKKLTDFEKLKAFLMQQVYLHAEEKKANNVISHLESHFATMYQEMERIHLLNENSVLRHHDHAYSRHWETPVQNIKKDLASIPDKEDKVHFISRYCEALAATFQHVREIEELAKTEEHVADPLILGPATAWPLIIKLYSMFHRSITKRHDVLKLLRNVEICLFKMDFQHGGVTNNLIEKAKHLRSEADLPMLCQNMETAVHRGFAHNRWNFDNDAIGWFMTDQCFAPIARYALWKYENDLGLDNDRKVSPWDYLNLAGKNNMQSTTEHVSSQNPRDSHNTEAFRAKFLNNIGNLAFMPRGMNSTLGNRPDQEKRPMLEASSYGAHREIAEMIGRYGGWNESAILARKDLILAFIKRRWEISVPETSSASA